jgi:23S rRNA (cytosine1962-C5)-methyltransferase
LSGENDRKAAAWLKPGREKSLQRRHPWVFSGAVAAVMGDPAPGDTVEILDSSGEFLAYGAYSPHSQIRLRVWSWDPAETIGQDFLRLRLQTAIAYRASLPWVTGEFSQRLVHAESDGLPGLVVDRYSNVLVVQMLSAGVERWRETIAELLLELSGVEHIYERSDADVRALEGLASRTGPLRGSPATLIEMKEHGLRFRVDIANGHKTGFYLDQRQNRLLVRDFVQDTEVLDCFCYSGGFLVNALAAGARAVAAVDSAEDALSLARQNVMLNGLALERVEWHCQDVFQQLRRFRDQGRTFDTIILDPPKFAPTTAHVEKASRGYKDINLLAFKLLRPGGTLLTFSCSGGVSPDLFQKIVASAALDAGARPRLLAHLEQSPDHPVALEFPEGAYLKGLVLRI